jgi:hypothetical protein
MAVREVWSSVIALPLKAKRATALLGADPFVLDLVLLHALDGNKTMLASADGFAQLVAVAVKKKKTNR